MAVDEALVRRLIADQFPEVEPASVRPFAEGWDNAVWLVDERWAFRFPRRQIAIPGVEREIAVLPGLAPALPLGVPAPVFVGRPGLGYPWPFFGAALLPGVEAGDAALSDEARVRLAELGDLWRPPAVVEELFERALALPAPMDRVVLHGDLHFRHLLVDGDGALTGVIDWGDVCCGDPSIDLSLLWSFFPPDGRDAFLEVYGLLGEDQLVRARVLAVCLCATLALYGHHEAMPGVKREALEGLDRAVA